MAAPPAGEVNTTISAIADEVSKLTSITGTATRTSPAKVAGVEVLLQRDSDDKYWDSTGWQVDLEWVTAIATDGAFDSSSEDWRYSAVPTWEDGVTYTFKARAVDNYSAKDATPATETFIVDKTDPDTTIDAIDDTVDELTEITGTATDEAPTLAGVEVQIKDTDTDKYWDDEDEDWTSAETWNDAEAKDGTFNEESETWEYTTVPEWENGVIYEVKARAVDEADNEDETPAEESFTFEKKLVLDSIAWNDVNNSDTIDKGDKLTFKFNLPVDTTTLDSADEINDRLDSSAEGTTDYGDALTFSWNTAEDQLTVTLANGEKIKGGESVNPKSTVKDEDGNGDATSGAGPKIPEASGTEGIEWQWWHFLLIGLGALLVILIIYRIIMRRRKAGLEEEDIDGGFGEEEEEL